MPITLLTVKRTHEYKDPDFMGSNPRHCSTLFTTMEIRLDLQLQGMPWPLTPETRQAQAIATDALLAGDGKRAIDVLNSVGCGLSISVTGCCGYVVTAAQARAEARKSWESYWEDLDEDQRREWNESQGTRIRSERSFARYVINADGEYHGLDVHEDRGKTVLVGHSWGCLHDAIWRSFPEVESCIADHLTTPCEASIAYITRMLEQDRIAA